MWSALLSTCNHTAQRALLTICVLYSAVEEVRRLRCNARGEALPGAQPDPERDCRRALLEWTRRQLYSPKSAHQRTIVDFHTFFPILCKRGAEEVVRAVREFVKEIAAGLELVRARTSFCFLLARTICSGTLQGFQNAGQRKARCCARSWCLLTRSRTCNCQDWIIKGKSPDGSPLPDLTALDLTSIQAILLMAVEEAITTPIAEPLLSAVKVTYDQQPQHRQKDQCNDHAAILAYLRQLPPGDLAETLGVSARFLDAASARSGLDGAWSQSATALSAIGYAASASAKSRGLQVVLFSIEHELVRPAVRACSPAGTGMSDSTGTDLPEGVPPEPQSEPVVLGADELLPVVKWVVVRSNIIGLSAMLAYVEQLLGDSYWLATFQQAMMDIGMIEIPTSNGEGGIADGGMTEEEGASLVAQTLTHEPGQ